MHHDWRGKSGGIMGVSEFGTTTGGKPVHKITLANGELTVAILTKGATLQSVRLAGVPYDLTLGSDRLGDYEGKMRSFGALVAPVVNRLSQAIAPIAGKPHEFEPNQSGQHTLHSGSAGTQHKVWTMGEITETSATLTIQLPNGEGGFPGNRHVTATFTLNGPTLRLEVSATTDALTLFNAANHSYWNLDSTPTWAGHSLKIAADTYLPTTAEFIPTGEIDHVTGTHFDLRQSRVITPETDAYDTNFCLSTEREPLRDVLWLTGSSGLTLTIATTEPGIQVYDGRAAIRPGKTAYEGLAFEAQNWPDAPNHAGFPSIELHPGETYHQITEWKFSR
jgi:aldose 1-epimerase